MSEQISTKKVKKQVRNTISVKDFLKMGSKYRDVQLMVTGVRKYTTDKNELSLLEKYYYLIVNTDYLRPDVYAFLVDQKSYKEVVEEFGVHENYIRNIIYKEVNRLYEDITEDPFALIRYKKDFEGSEEEYKAKVIMLEERVERLISNLSVRRTNDLLDYMVVNLERYSEAYNEYNGEIDNDVLEETVDRIKYLSQPYLDRLFSVVDKRILGYVIYLLSSNPRNLSDRDNMTREEICELLMLPKNK